MSEYDYMGTVGIPEEARQKLTEVLRALHAEVLATSPGIDRYTAGMNAVALACIACMSSVDEAAPEEIRDGVKGWIIARLIDAVLEQSADCCAHHYGLAVAQIGNLAIQQGKARRAGEHRSEQ